MNFKDDYAEGKERTPTQMVIPAKNIFDKLENLTLHSIALEDELHHVWFFTKIYFVALIIVNIIITCGIIYLMG